MTKEYEGKLFSLLGDSISTLAGYNPPECAVFYDWQNKRQAEIRGPEDTWWGYVLEALGGQLLVNHSWSGSLVSKLPQCEIQSYGSSDSRTSALEAEGQVPNVILILMGLNDFGWGVGPEAFAAAYETMLLKLRFRYSQAEIWCMTLPVSRWSKNPDFAPPPAGRGGASRIITAPSGFAQRNRPAGWWTYSARISPMIPSMATIPTPRVC